MNTTKINRLEIIDHTRCFHCGGTGDGTSHRICEHCHGNGFPGREVIMWDDNKELKIDVQDDGRTLKVFITDRD